VVPPTPLNTFSPRWSITTKLVIGLTLAAILTFLLIQFRNIIGPLLISMILSYLLYPLADNLRKKLRLGWRFSVTLIYLVVLIVLISLLVWGGISLVEQVGALIRFLEVQVDNLPALLTNLAAHPVTFGPFSLDLNTVELNSVINQAMNAIEPLFSRLGTLVTSFASTTAVTIGWIAFILLISYFILVESGGSSGRMIRIEIPGYENDLNRMRIEFSRIWNSFLRGQMIIIGIIIVTYSVVLGAEGVHFFYGLAILAGLARFVPYVGPAIAWTTYGLVSYFQGTTLFGIPPLTYALVVVGTAWVTDAIMDNFVAPRIIGNALKVHPAAVMVAALVAASLLGVIGVILAAPVLATAKLVLDYVIKKLADRDPFEELETEQPAPSIRSRIESSRVQIGRWLERTRQIIKNKPNY
jgi:predicted PurR-regulated permease PerM